MALPERYRPLEARQRIAHRRHADLKTRYFREISEFPLENRRVERQIAIDIIRKLKGLFRYYPDAVFLELPIRELGGHGRIRWREDFLGILPTRSNSGGTTTITHSKSGSPIGRPFRRLDQY